MIDSPDKLQLTPSGNQHMAFSAAVHFFSPLPELCLIVDHRHVQDLRVLLRACFLLLKPIVVHWKYDALRRPELDLQFNFSQPK
jgi:hypothetical protein